MDELKTDTEEQKAPAQQTIAPRAVSGRRRLLAIALSIVAVILIAAVVTHRGDARREDAAAPASSTTTAPDTVEATPDQLKQIRIEPVRADSVDLDLETTGKVGFNEDRMTPVFAPYSGRVLEVLANKGDLVKAGQPLLFLETPD